LKTFGQPLPGITYIERPGAYALLFNDAKNLAVVKTGFGYFLPGGGADPEEDLETALRRELLEEIAFELTSARLIGQAAQYHWSEFYQSHFKKIGSFYFVEGAWLSRPTPPDHALLWLPLREAARALTQEFQAWMVANCGD
jgi:8-oxo-dGTP pyrophosphatase MutT (NUDIX family)